MATEGVEYEDQINEWTEAFEELPEEQREQIVKWFAVQRLIIEQSGIEMQEWCAYLEWAMNNPLDYRFILDFPATGEVVEEIKRDPDNTKAAKELVGADGIRKPATGRGIMQKKESGRKVDKELFNRFMNERLKPGSGTK